MPSKKRNHSYDAVRNKRFDCKTVAVEIPRR